MGPVLVVQWLRHRVEMRKMDQAEAERALARKAILDKVEQVEKNTNGLVADKVRSAENKVHEAYIQSGFPSLKTEPGTLE